MDNCYPPPFEDVAAIQIYMGKDVRKFGMLKKKTGGMKIPLIQNKYDSRFVIINRGWVYYYKDKASEKPQGKFSLQGFSSTVINAEEEEATTPFVFKIYSKKANERTWYFATDNHQDKEDWKEAFRLEIEQYNVKGISNIRPSKSCPVNQPNKGLSRPDIHNGRPQSVHAGPHIPPRDLSATQFPSRGTGMSQFSSHTSNTSGIGSSVSSLNPDDIYEPVEVFSEEEDSGHQTTDVRLLSPLVRSPFSPHDVKPLPPVPEPFEEWLQPQDMPHRPPPMPPAASSPMAVGPSKPHSRPPNINIASFPSSHNTGQYGGEGETPSTFKDHRTLFSPTLAVHGAGGGRLNMTSLPKKSPPLPKPSHDFNSLPSEFGSNTRVMPGYCDLTEDESYESPYSESVSDVIYADGLSADNPPPPPPKPGKKTPILQPHQLKFGPKPGTPSFQLGPRPPDNPPKPPHSDRKKAVAGQKTCEDEKSLTTPDELRSRYNVKSPGPAVAKKFGETCTASTENSAGGDKPPWAKHNLKSTLNPAATKRAPGMEHEKSSSPPVNASKPPWQKGGCKSADVSPSSVATTRPPLAQKTKPSVPTKPGVAQKPKFGQPPTVSSGEKPAPPQKPKSTAQSRNAKPASNFTAIRDRFAQ